jgi:AcrR family transcriptional regulator
MGKELPPEKIKCIYDLYSQGASINQIIKICHVSPGTVYRYLKREGGKEGDVEGGQEVGKEVVKKVEPKVEVPVPQTRTRGETRYVGTGVAEVMKVLGSEYADMLKTVLEKTQWFTEALVNIGWLSTIAAFQYARVDPKDIPKKLSEFQDADKFVEFVGKYLIAMIQGSADATNIILEKDRELSKWVNASKTLAAIVKGLKVQVKDLTRQLEIAQALMTKYGILEEFVNALAQHRIIEALALAPIQTQEVKEEVKEEGVEVKA